jgi:serine/threonine protein kinase
VNNRLKVNNKVFYEEDELVNTFTPIIECICYIHQKGLIHSSISPKNIIFDEEGDVMLRDWLVELPNNKYY